MPVSSEGSCFSQKATPCAEFLKHQGIFWNCALKTQLETKSKEAVTSCSRHMIFSILRIGMKFPIIKGCKHLRRGPSCPWNTDHSQGILKTNSLPDSGRGGLSQTASPQIPPSNSLFFTHCVWYSSGLRRYFIAFICSFCCSCGRSSNSQNTERAMLSSAAVKPD